MTGSDGESTSDLSSLTAIVIDMLTEPSRFSSLMDNTGSVYPFFDAGSVSLTSVFPSVIFLPKT